MRILLSAILAALGLWICKFRLPQRLIHLEPRRFDLLFLAVFAASRFLVFFTAFFLLHQKPHADLPGYYVPQAHSVLNGLVPYRDFPSSYAPLNPYLDALLLRIHNSPFSILVFQILCDIISIPFWIGFLRRFLSESTVRRSALLFLVQPLVLWGTCIDGKNHACISLLLAIALFIIARREIASGVTYSLSLVLVKILPVIFLPAFFTGAKKRTKWFLSAITIPIVVYGGFLLHHVDVTFPVRAEGSLRTPGNLLYLIALISGHILSSRLCAGIALLGGAAAVSIAVFAQLHAQTDADRTARLSLGTLLILFTVLLLSKKSDPIYLTMCFFLISAFTAAQVERSSRWTPYFYALLSFLALPIASFWFWPLREASGPRLHAMLFSGDRLALVMTLAQIALVASYLFFMAKFILELYARKPWRSPSQPDNSGQGLKQFIETL